jgi:hypothetical protein
MTDLDAMLDDAAGAPRAATQADVEADVARGRRALRGRRTTFAAAGALTVALAAGLAVAVSGGGTTEATPPAPAPAPATTAQTTFIAYTGAQPEGFRVATVPSGWRIQGVNEYALLIVPPGNDRPGSDVELSTFTGKLVVMLESQDATGLPDGTPIRVGDRDGVVSKQGDGYGSIHWTDAAGKRLVVQWPLDAGWSDREVADFAAGVKVLAAAQASRG